MPDPLMGERFIPGVYPWGPPRPRPEHDRRPIVLPHESPRLPEGFALGEEPDPNPGWRG